MGDRNRKGDAPAPDVDETDWFQYDEEVSTKTYRAREKINNSWREGVLETTITTHYGMGAVAEEPSIRESIEYRIENNVAHAQHHAKKHGFDSTLQKVPNYDEEKNRIGSCNAGVTKEPNTKLRCAYDLEINCSLLRQSLDRIDALNLPADVHREVIMAIHRGMEVSKYKARLETRENAKLLMAGGGLFNNTGKLSEEEKAASVSDFWSLVRRKKLPIGEAEKVIMKKYGIGRTLFRRFRKEFE